MNVLDSHAIYTVRGISLTALQTKFELNIILLFQAKFWIHVDGWLSFLQILPHYYNKTVVFLNILKRFRCKYILYIFEFFLTSSFCSLL
jgi:hypothetical protein